MGFSSRPGPEVGSPCSTPPMVGTYACAPIHAGARERLPDASSTTSNGRYTVSAAPARATVHLRRCQRYYARNRLTARPILRRMPIVSSQLWLGGQRGGCHCDVLC